MAKTIYLDNGATTKVDKKAIEAMLPFFDNVFGNPSSNHEFGFSAQDAVNDARSSIAKSIGAKSDEIIFTCGGTEANNHAVKGVAWANKERGNHIITVKTEHKAILNVCKWLENQGFITTYLDVDKEGFVNSEDLKKAITPETILVSIMHANNEIGTIQNLEELGAICKENKILFHSDACQSYTKVDIDVNKQNLDLVSLNSHKIHGPKGVGALYVRKGTKIDNLFHGGSQENAMRAGTENVPGIVGFAEAVRQSSKDKHIAYMKKIQNKLIDSVLETYEHSERKGENVSKRIEGTILNGPKGDSRLCNNVNISFKGIEGEAIGGLLDQNFVASSTGSACSSASLDPSYVLKAIGLTDEEANGSLRITLSRDTTEEEIDRVIKLIPNIVKKLRRISPFGKLLKKLSIGSKE